MTISHVGEETATGSPPAPAAPAGPEPDPLLTPVAGLAAWRVDLHQGLTGEATSSEDDGLEVSYAGAGDLLLMAPGPIAAPRGAVAVQLWVDAPGPRESEQTAQLWLQLAGGQELPLGPLDFHGGHLLRHTLPAGARLSGLAARGLFSRDGAQLGLRCLAFEGEGAAPEPTLALPRPYGPDPSMLPTTSEAVTNSTAKDGISFVFEARSLSAVVRYVYTPIEGNLSDFEVEINNGDAIKMAEAGGIDVSMEGKEWRAADEEVQRHFVSCEQVGDAVEARWQFRHGSELADFLYRIRIAGKSLLVELEGGGGRAAGVELGYVVGAIHPRLIRIPYFNLGAEQPIVLCTSGVFISSLLDWYTSAAADLYGAPATGDPLMHLNGGCRYRAASDGRRPTMRERWVLTVSRRFEEVLPQPARLSRAGERAALPPGMVWCQLPEMAAGEEAYVEAYERLRMFRQVGMTDLLVLHPESTWHDGSGGMPALDSVGARAKGGDDAFVEYLEAVKDLGYAIALQTSFRHISPHDGAWSTALVGLDGGGQLAATGPGRYLLKPSRAAAVRDGRIARLVERYGASYAYLGDHAAQPPWERVDCDRRLPAPASFQATLRAEQALLGALARESPTPVVGDGGSHWLYPGLLAGYVANLRGAAPAEQPLLVDFALRYLHGLHVDAGVGPPETFFAREVPADERDSRSPWFDRWLMATVTFAHAGLLPDLEAWGLPAVAKTYYMLRRLQTSYLGARVESIHYQRGGNLLETTEALVAGAHDLSQVRILYDNGLQVYANGAREEDWTVTIDDATSYRLPPASFLARGPGDLLVYSADAGLGRIDYASCPEYLYCDTRGARLTMGALTLTGAAVLTHADWVIDIYPLDCTEPLEIDPAAIWKNRRMPPLRVLAFRDEEDVPDVLMAHMGERGVTIRPQDDVYRYRITLPEWMVEPGR